VTPLAPAAAGRYISGGMPPEALGLKAVEWEPCALERRPDPELTRWVRKRIGMVPGHLDYYTPCPWIARQFVYWDATQIPLLAVEPGLVQMISLVVAQDNSCRYCFAATRIMLRALGFGDGIIRVLEEDVAAADLPPATRAALEFARRLSRANPLPGPDALAPLAAAGFGPDAVREIVYLTALHVLANRVITLAAIPVDGIERLSGSWWIPLLRPVATILARRARRRVRPEPLPAAMREGPFAHVVRAFDGHPLGPRLWTQIDEAWQSPLLPRRAKALVAAVVGRALGCRRSEDEARRLLAAEGGALDLDGVLAHLTSPTLTDAEAAIAPFVRETAHYSPAPIQRRGRLVYERLGQAAFLETIGVAALANALCRMTAVLVPREP
jgi:alkylhydroperoxidase family enzyme